MINVIYILFSKMLEPAPSNILVDKYKNWGIGIRCLGGN